MRKSAIAFSMVLFLVGVCFVNAQTDGDNTNFDFVAGDAPGDSLVDYTRHVISGTDMDQDGKPEIIVTQYADGGSVIIFEVIANNTIEQVWQSQDFGSSYSSPCRSLAAGLLDANTKTDLVVYVGSTSVNDSIAGLYIFEWDGVNDNGFEQVAWLYFAAYDSGYYRTEDIALADFDNDDQNEIAFANWGSGSYLESRTITIWSVDGEFSTGFYSWNREFKATREELGAGGSLTGAFCGDVDNDGHPECWISVYDKLSLAVVESDAKDTYHIANYISQIDTSKDTYILKGCVITDLNKDESQELFLEGTHNGKTYMVTAPTGSVDDSLLVQPAPFDLGPFSTMMVGDQDHGTVPDGLDIYSGGTSQGIIDYEYQSGSLLDTSSYTRTIIYNEPDTSITGDYSWFVSVPYPNIDMDGDGYREVVSAWGGMPDSVGGEPYDKKVIRVIEFGQAVGINDDWTIITPDKYVLEQNYPNPFNPTTSIEFYLPINKKISLTIYNALGQKVKTLINNEMIKRGSHLKEWDSTNSAGVKVASGMYIYELKFGNFTLSKRMMLLK